MMSMASQSFSMSLAAWKGEGERCRLGMSRTARYSLDEGC